MQGCRIIEHLFYSCQGFAFRQSLIARLDGAGWVLLLAVVLDEDDSVLIWLSSPVDAKTYHICLDCIIRNTPFDVKQFAVYARRKGQQSHSRGGRIRLIPRQKSPRE